MVWFVWFVLFVWFVWFVCVVCLCCLFVLFVFFVLRSCDLVPGAAVSSCSSAVALGVQFALSGLSWRPRIPLVVRRDLCFQFSTLRSLPSLRLPPVW